jgi:predicted HAD superfamily phosphohydrolase YqeG
MSHRESISQACLFNPAAVTFELPDVLTAHMTNPNPQIVYVDVDDTLVRSVGAKRIPMPRVVDRVRSLHREGAILYLWSSGGADYAQESARELGISELFTAFLPKPNLIIDDQPVSDWRYCEHKFPMSS